MTDNEFDKGAKSLTEMTNLLGDQTSLSVSEQARNGSAMTDPSAKSYMEEVISAAQNHLLSQRLTKICRVFL